MQTCWLARFGLPSRLESVMLSIISCSLTSVSRLVPNLSLSRPVLIEKELESKHRFLRSTFLRLRCGNASDNDRVHIALASKVSDQIYGSEVKSSYQLAHIFTKQLNGYHALLLDDFTRLTKCSELSKNYSHPSVEIPEKHSYSPQ